jgi:hypothetical protein
MNKRLGLPRIAGLTTCAALAAALLLFVPSAFGAGNAAYTTYDTTLQGCLNGSPNGINCNNYADKADVYINGGPSGGNGLAGGDYYFAVLTPGSQNDGFIDGATGNLSSGNDLSSNRTFTVANGLLSSYGGDHALGTDPQGNAVIALAPFDDTNNPGGVYIVAICSVGASSPSDCKFDAFKVNGTSCTSDCGTGVAKDLSVTKDAAGAYKTTYTWTAAKSVDSTLVKQVGGTATFHYTVTASHDAGTISNVAVTGTIQVTNPNSDSVSGVDVSDELSDNTVCAISGGANNGSNETLASGVTSFTYSCSLGSLPSSSLDNTVTVSWPTQFLADDGTLVGSNSPYTFSGISFSGTNVDNCATVKDTFNGGSPSTLGYVCVGDSPAASNLNQSLAGFSESYSSSTRTFTFLYARTLNVPTNNCVDYLNTASVTTNTSLSTSSSSQVSVRVCGPARTGALTMGFWQNKNGQAIISGGASLSGVCKSGTWLKQYAPFQDLSSSATCSAVASYVLNVIKAATCTSTTKTCNSMLKAQMLATALDVYFSDPALGLNKINAPAPIGGVSIDLTKICHMIDGSGGSASCSGTLENVSSAFGGATSLTVSQMLAYAATQSNAGGSTWYGNVKATQVLAKDAFDAINNQVAFSP